MTRSRLPLLQLQAFEAVARLGSYKAAVAELGSNAYKHVAALEANLGLVLINGSPRGSLTPHGQILARALTGAFDEMAALLAEIGSGPIEPARMLELLIRYSQQSDA